MTKGNPLTPREREVLQLLWQGLTTRDIARSLQRSFNTIAMHRKHILLKFGVTSTPAALRIALDRRMIMPNE